MAGKKDTKPGWKSIPIGGLILKPGSAAEFETGDWRTERPIWNNDKCINCMRCVVHCPDMSFFVKDGKIVGIDYDHCKGCGVCVSVCPPKVQALHMEPESKHRED